MDVKDTSLGLGAVYSSKTDEFWQFVDMHL